MLLGYLRCLLLDESLQYFDYTQKGMGYQGGLVLTCAIPWLLKADPETHGHTDIHGNCAI